MTSKAVIVMKNRLAEYGLLKGVLASSNYCLQLFLTIIFIHSLMGVILRWSINIIFDEWELEANM